MRPTADGKRSERVLKGLEILMKAVGANTGYVAIEENKPESIRIMKEKNENPIYILLL